MLKYLEPPTVVRFLIQKLFQCDSFNVITILDRCH